MKTTGILQAAIWRGAIALGLVIILASCGSSRRYQDYGPPPPPRTSVSLIVNPGPGLVINRYNDGRYYYRSPQGYTYWRGYGNRYYLDQRYVNRNYHRHNQYGDWRRYHGRRR